MIALTTLSSDGTAAISLIKIWAAKEDHAQTVSWQNVARKRDFLLARSALRAVLAHVTGRGDWRIRPDTHGKPYTYTPSGEPGPHISISHTRGLIACAVSQTEALGIDVEYWRERDFKAIATYAFGPLEIDDVEKNGIAAFYRIWVLKEARAKAASVGVMSLLNGKDTTLNTEKTGCWQTPSGQLYYISPRPHYSLALATQNYLSWSEAIFDWVRLEPE